MTVQPRPISIPILVAFVFAIFAPFAIHSAYSAPAAPTPVEKSFAERQSAYEDDPILRGLPHIGLQGGVSDLPSDDAGGMIGVDVGWQPVRPISLGANFAVAGPTQDNSRTMLLGKGAVNLGGDLPIIRYSYIGAQAGWVRDTVEVANFFKFTEDYFAVGPTVGFDQPIASAWTIGGEARYLFNFTDAADENFAAGAMLKYWF